MAHQPQEHHPAFEEYAETIYELAEDGVAVIQARIAERLEISRPSVSEMVKRMEDEGLIRAGDSAEIELTPAGVTLASTMVRRHRLAERFMTDILELDWTTAHEEAGRWEHIISPTVEAALLRALGDPTTCPHGNPIPGTDYVEPDDAQPLADLAAGADFTVLRVQEELEFVDGQLEFLENAGLMPGRGGTILSFAPDGTATVQTAAGPVGLAAAVADKIVVTPA